MPNQRKPDNVHRLNGTYDVSRHGKPEDKPDWDDGFPEMPGCIAKDPGAEKEWEYIKSVAPVGVIVKTDKSILTQYCLLWSELDQRGIEFGATKHGQLKLVQQELGFTPISRGKIGGAPKAHDDDGPQTIPR